MIDQFTIFHKGGKVLWGKQMGKIRGNPINQLIKTVLLEERTGDTFFMHDAYKLHWILANEFELVFVVVYQKILQLLYLDELLQKVKDTFCETYKQALATDQSRMDLVVQDFDKKFMAILQQVEEEAERKRRGPKEKSFHASPAATSKGNSTEDEPTDPATILDDVADSAGQQGSEMDREAHLRKVLSAKGSRKGKMDGSTKKPKKSDSMKDLKKAASSNEIKPKRTKQMAESWKERPEKDKAAPVSQEEVDRFAKEFNPTGKVGENYTEEWQLDDDSESDDEAPDLIPADGKKEEPAPKGRFAKFFSRMPFTDQVLDDEALAPMMTEMRHQLVSKNVAAEIADKLCDSVSENLKGTTVGKFSRVSTKIREAMEKALVRILTPKREVNILRDVAKAKADKRPYTIVFCGVNGVGKSTNLAKICYWLTHNGLDVMVAACDTFRSGAVEQLRIHTQCLGASLYERGYNKDAAGIAADAIAQAKKEGRDVVLVDTAGRMQDNEPLMRSLTKLINVNNPDLILFVGEALVGNDGVDQVVRFNQALRDLSDKPNPRLIDGIVLTKFDTIDDKVGASISMVYSTGQPIVFVGVGQTYTDLKKLNAGVVVDLLLK